MTTLSILAATCRSLRSSSPVFDASLHPLHLLSLRRNLSSPPPRRSRPPQSPTGRWHDFAEPPPPPRHARPKRPKLPPHSHTRTRADGFAAAPAFRGLSAARVLDLASRDGGRWRPADVSAALSAFSKDRGWAARQGRAEMLRLAKASVTGFGPKQFAASLTSCKNMGVGRDAGAQDFIHIVCERIVGHHGRFEGRHVAQSLNALAGIGGGREEQVVERLCKEIGEGVPMTAQEMANVLSALAKLEHRDEAAVEHICSKIVLLPDGALNGQNVSNTLNALAKLCHRDQVTIARLCEEALRLAPGLMTAQNLTVSLNALARLGYRDELVIAHLCDAIMLLPAGSVSAQGLTNAMNALAKFGYGDAVVLAFLCQEILNLAPGAMVAQGVANALNAMAKLEYSDKDVLSHLCKVALSLPVGSMNAQNVGNSLNALAKLEYEDSAVLTRLCAETVGLPVGSMNMQNVLNVKKALDRFGHRDAAVSSHLKEELQRLEAERVLAAEPL